MQRMSYMVVNVFLLFADSSDNKEKKSFSLEEKSKTSKNRVHYMKFTKGKSRHSPGEVCMLALGFLSHCDLAQCYSMGCLFEVLNGAVWSAWWVDLRQPWVARAQCPCWLARHLTKVQIGVRWYQEEPRGGFRLGRSCVGCDESLSV